MHRALIWNTYSWVLHSQGDRTYEGVLDTQSFHDTIGLPSVSHRMRYTGLSYETHISEYAFAGRPHTAPEISWRRMLDPCTPLLFDLYHYLEQNGYFWLVPEHAPGPSSQVLPGCRVRHPCYSKKLCVRYEESPHHKEPYTSAEKPYISAKETYISTKERAVWGGYTELSWNTCSWVMHSQGDLVFYESPMYPWLSYMCAMTPAHVCHDSRICAMTPAAYVCHDSCTCVQWLPHMCAMNVCHDSLTCVPWLLHMCAMTPSHVCHDSFTRCHETLTRVPRLPHMCAMTPSLVCHDSHTCVPWLPHMCAMTPTHVCHDSLTCVPWLT